jgi:heme-degrading monooxygenase HmoA
MVVVLVHHWCKPGMVEAARARVDGNGDSMAEAPGFVFRYRIERPEDPLRISTVTGWTDRALYEAWRAEKNERHAKSGVPSPYERAVNEIFEVTHVHGDLRLAAGS